MSRYTEATIPKGIKATYRHHRERDGRILWTRCILFDGDRPVATGIAHASKREVSPSKKLGRRISLGRALKEYANE